MKHCLLFLAVILPYLSQCQEQLPESVYPYQDSLGNTYWNKSMPFRVRLSLDSTSAGVLLMSHTSKYAKNVKFDTEGPNYIRTRWAVDSQGKTINPKQEVLWEVYADGVPPRSRAEFRATTKYEFKGNTYYSKDLEISILATDRVSGVRYSYYSLNKEPFERYLGPVSVSTDNVFVLKYYSVDNVGNIEPVDSVSYSPDDNNIQFTVDAIPPETNIKVDSARGYVFGPYTKVTLSAEDVGSGVLFINYNLDDADSLNAIHYSKPFLIPDSLEHGKHVLHYFSVDYTSNIEHVTDVPFYYDKEAPVVYINASPIFYSDTLNTILSRETVISLKAIDHESGVWGTYYRFGDDEFKKYVGGVRYDHPSHDTYFSYYSIDSLGNSTDIYKLRVVLDTLPPVYDFDLSGPKFYIGDSLFITPESTLTMRSDDGDSEVLDSYVVLDSDTLRQDTIKIEREGFHLMSTYAVDRVMNEISKNYAVTVDSEPPKLKYHFSVVSEDSITYPSHVKLYLGAIDEHSGTKVIKYRVNGEEKFTQSTLLSGIRPGHVKVEVYIEDMLGNHYYEFIEFFVDK